MRNSLRLVLPAIAALLARTPTDENWFGFGLVAEAYGDNESARDYYARVEKPKKGPINASSVYAMTQARLAALPAARK